MNLINKIILTLDSIDGILLFVTNAKGVSSATGYFGTFMALLYTS